MPAYPEWLPATRVGMVHDAASLTARLLDGRMSVDTLRYDPEVLDLSSNENPLGAGVLAQQAVTRELLYLHRYPLVSSPMLRRLLAEQLHVADDEIVVGCGATGVLGVIAQLVLAPGAQAAYSRSSLFAYRQSTIFAHAETVEVPLTADFRHDLKALSNAARAGARLLLISNPHNPTGTVFDHAEFVQFLDSVPARTLVIIDEAYIEFAENPSLLPQSVSLTRTHPNLLVLRTFSKVHGLAYARVGYAVGQAPGIAAIEATGMAYIPGGVGLGQGAAEAALGDREHIERSVQHVAAERLWAYELLEELGMPYIRSHANFIMTCAGPETPQLVSFLRRNKVLVTSGEYFGYPEWFRFSLQRRAENEQFFGFLKEFRHNLRQHRQWRQ
jgi:histidinol-phosphate aminotransferase